jgi:putative ABC transport system substrate-binding protein
MRRREFINLIAGSAVTWPLTARAQQQTGKVWRVGYLTPSSATNASVALLDAFRMRLQELGYVVGRNLNLDVRTG